MTPHVSDVMTSTLVTVEPQVSVTAVARMMRDENIGIVSLGDLAIERDSESALGDISAARPNQ
ncbi:hypothetical protein ACGFZJ_11570 [Streptomyces sp. NPDC048253]|uniref:hypothetical protein n=1 Tax=Streptomyces sp. NPDC048253 TaxID=3365524 RepID=UPI0037140CD4